MSTSASRAYSIVESGGKGKVAVAARDILPGELIVSENEPLLTFTNESIFQQTCEAGMEDKMAAIKTFLKDLSTEQKEKVLALCGPTTGEYADFVRRFLSNTVEYRHLSGTKLETLVKVALVVKFYAFALGAAGHGIFQDFTRFSHSCQPNCSFTINGKAVYCYARTAIKKGKELNISFRGKMELEPTHERRFWNLATMGFTCHCPRCDVPGDDTRRFDCFDLNCKGEMMVCQPINQKKLPFSDLVYTGVEYVEPHLLPCTVCHRTAPADYQFSMFALETKMCEQGPRFVQRFNNILNRQDKSAMQPLLKELLSVPIQRRHAAALPFLRTEMTLRATIMRWQLEYTYEMLLATTQAAVQYYGALIHLLPYPSDNLCEELGNIVSFCCRSCIFPIFVSPVDKDMCGEALRMSLLLYGRNRRDSILDEAMFQCHEKAQSEQSTQVCAFCEESPVNAALTLSRCGRCRQVAYCSVGCQKAHWKLHKKSCTAPEGKK